MVLFISITCLYVFSSFSVRTSTCLIVFSCFSLRTCNSLAVFSCISLSGLLKSLFMSSTIIMRYALNLGLGFRVCWGALDWANWECSVLMMDKNKKSLVGPASYELEMRLLKKRKAYEIQATSQARTRMDTRAAGRPQKPKALSAPPVDPSYCKGEQASWSRLSMNRAAFPAQSPELNPTVTVEGLGHTATATGTGVC
uniref:ASL1/novel spliced gene fusion protein n=1 Tax=Mus musculus TaxID=10090 RepID=C6EQG3_MOUSE|nr:ASL1/novel spliced gene fusion protein [Mus musculus]